MFGRNRHESKIDILVKEQSKLIVEKQKIKDSLNEENSRIETKIKELENLSYRNKQIADGKIAELDRKIKKGQDQIDLEANYYSDLVNNMQPKNQNENYEELLKNAHKNSKK